MDWVKSRVKTLFLCLFALVAGVICAVLLSSCGANSNEVTTSAHASEDDTHTWEYSKTTLDGQDCIVANCNKADCSLPNKNDCEHFGGQLFITADDCTYDGKTHTATVVNNFISSAANTAYEIVYYYNAEAPVKVTEIDSYAEIVVGAKDAGYYLAQLKVKGTDGQIISVAKNFVINKATLTYKANDATITFGENPAGNGVSFCGFVDGENLSNTEITSNIVYKFAHTNFTATDYKVINGGYVDEITVDENNSTFTAKNYKISKAAQNFAGTLNVVPLNVYVDGVSAESRQYNGKNDVTFNKQDLCIYKQSDGSDVTQFFKNTGASLTFDGQFASCDASSKIYKIPVSVTVSGDSASCFNFKDLSLTAYILPAELQITLKDTEYVFGKQSDVLYELGDAQNGENVKVTVEYYSEQDKSRAVTPQNAGNYLAVASINNPNYKLVGTLSANYVITKKPLFVSTDKDYKLTYGEEIPSFALIFKDDEGKAINFDDIKNDVIAPTYECEYLRYQDITGDGRFAIKVIVQNSENSNYSLAGVNGTLIVEKAQVAVNANDVTITYGDKLTGGGVTYSGFVHGDNENSVNIDGDVTYNFADIAYNKGTHSGAITVDVSDLLATNYNFVAGNSGAVIVNALPVEVCGLAATNKTYDNDVKTCVCGTAQITNAGGENVNELVASSGVELKYTAQFDSSDKGEGKAVTINLYFENNTYGNFTLINDKINCVADIAAANITVTAQDKTSHYGDEIAELSAKVTEGLLYDDAQSVYTLFTTATQNSPVGSYQINLSSNGERAKNYVVTCIPATYTITAREITVTITSLHAGVGEDVKALTSTITKGSLFGGDNAADLFELQTLATAESEEGLYPITGKKLENELSKNYDITFVDGTYVVGNLKITVKINDAESAYGEKISALSGEVTSGFILTGETASDVFELYTDATPYSAVGTYKIYGKVINNYYSVEFVNGTYTVYEATANNAQSISLNKTTVAKPQEDLSKLDLSGEEPEYILSTEEQYEVKSITKTDSGKYVVVLGLKDADSFVWADGSSYDIQLTFDVPQTQSEPTSLMWLIVLLAIIYVAELSYVSTFWNKKSGKSVALSSVAVFLNMYLWQFVIICVLLALIISTLVWHLIRLAAFNHKNKKINL
jgi:hypothetical protein